MLKRFFPVAVLIVFALTSTACMRFYRMPLTRPAAMSQATFNERFVELEARVLGEVAGVDSTRFDAGDETTPATVMVVLDGSRSTEDVKADVDQIIEELGLSEDEVSVQMRLLGGTRREVL